MIKILTSGGATAAWYEYDAWGNVVSVGGNASIANLNPIRYRGYYYDAETGFYYLNSRYYDPEVCRFINADGYTSTGQGLLGNNMFAYCLNNPISNVDSSGSIPMRSTIVCDGSGTPSITPYSPPTKSKSFLEKTGESILAITRGATIYIGVGGGIGANVSAPVGTVSASASAEAKVDLISLEWGKGEIFFGITEEASIGANMIANYGTSYSRRHSFTRSSHCSCTKDVPLPFVYLNPWDRSGDCCSDWEIVEDTGSSKIVVSAGAYCIIGASISVEYDYLYVINEFKKIW